MRIGIDGEATSGNPLPTVRQVNLDQGGVTKRKSIAARCKKKSSTRLCITVEVSSPIAAAGSMFREACLTFLGDFLRCLLELFGTVVT